MSIDYPLTAETVRRRNNIRLIGTGKHLLVMAHGFGCDQEVWRFLVPSLQRDFRIVLFDFTGFGNSDYSAYHDENFRSLEDYATTLLEVMDTLSPEPVNFVGHSVSAIIGGLAQRRHPERFAKMAMICPSPCYLNQPPDYFGGFEKKDIMDLLNLMETNDFQWATVLSQMVALAKDHPAVGEELKQRFCAALPAAARNWARLTFLGDYRAEMAQMSAPTLILHCRTDAISTREVAEFLQKTIPNNRTIFLEATGHCPHLTHPELVSLYLKEFLG